MPIDRWTPPEESEFPVEADPASQDDTAVEGGDYVEADPVVEDETTYLGDYVAFEPE